MGGSPPAAHVAFESLRQALVGTWEGTGHGQYPTIAPFQYEEQVTFAHPGKPFLAYQQRTWRPGAGTPMHAETGYLRTVGGDGRPEGPHDVELLVAHPTGIVEVEEGTFCCGRLQLQTTSVGLASTAKEVRSLRRDIRVDAHRLTYDLSMAHASTAESHHLHAELCRIP